MLSSKQIPLFLVPSSQVGQTKIFFNGNFSRLITRLNLTHPKRALPTAEYDEPKAKDALSQGNSVLLEHLLRDFILSAFSSDDFSDEKNYQIMVLTLSALLFPDYIVKSEVNAGTGRCDIMMVPKGEENIGIVIEIKKLASVQSKKRLLLSAENALKQIESHDYYEELRSRKLSILLFGMVFSKKQVKILSKRVESIDKT